MTLSELHEMVKHQEAKIKVLKSDRESDRMAILRLQGRVIALENGSLLDHVSDRTSDEEASRRAGWNI
ncbi:MAG: hypothetical protein ABGX83_05385 [Nitrospira sp.]